MQQNTRKEKKNNLAKKGIELTQVRPRKTIRINYNKVKFKINHMAQTKIPPKLWNWLK